MKEILTLSAEKRQGTGTHDSRRLRHQGRVPGIVYGHKQDPLPVALDYDALETAIRHHTRMLDLDIDGNRERVLLAEVQHDTFGIDVVHADFIRVAMDEVIRLGVPIVLRGKAKGEQHGGVTEQLMTEVQVECLPGDIPDSITLIVTELEVGMSVHVRELQVPDKVKFVSDPEQLVVTVALPKKIVEEVAPVVAAAEGAEEAEPEVIVKGKGEEETEEEAEDAKKK
jgi:large subunit ribosomal protein L25